MLFGHFLELAITTDDIVASVQFYEQLGFTQLITGDAWSHRYGVLSDGRLHLGLHEQSAPASAVRFVRPELRRTLPELESAGFIPETTYFGDDDLHRLLLRDPGGNAVTLLEARTYSPAPGVVPGSLCGYFAQLSLPQSDLEAAGGWWERGGFVALPKQRKPYAHRPLTSDALTLALHTPRTYAAPLLVFECADLVGCLQRLHALGIRVAAKLPRGLDPSQSALLEAPEGTGLLLLQSAD